MNKHYKILFPLFFAFILTSCSTVYDNTVGLFESDSETLPEEVEDTRSEVVTPDDNVAEKSAVAKDTTSVPVEELVTGPSSDEVEILWEIPKEEVDGFVLKYGASRDALNSQKTLQISDIEKYDDPTYGFVYRYVLKNVAANATLYVQLATTQNNERSEFSEVFTVEPAK